MTFAETVIKLTDYPFLYSVVTLFLTYTSGNILESEPSRIFLLLGMLGVFGTILSILDPVGYLIRRWYIHTKGWLKSLSHNIKKRLSNREKLITFSQTPGTYWKKYISTHWISYEIDRIVSMIYFLIIILVLICIIHDQKFYTSFLNPGGKIDFFYYLLWGVLIISFLLLIVKIVRSIGNIGDQLRIIHTYFMINQHIDQYKKVEFFNELKEQADNLLTALNNRDWGTAELLANSIRRINKDYHLPE